MAHRGLTHRDHQSTKTLRLREGEKCRIYQDALASWPRIHDTPIGGRHGTTKEKRDYLYLHRNGPRLL
jgi:hypothetical protein